MISSGKQQIWLIAGKGSEAKQDSIWLWLSKVWVSFNDESANDIFDGFYFPNKELVKNFKNNWHDFALISCYNAVRFSNKI